MMDWKKIAGEAEAFMERIGFTPVVPRPQVRSVADMTIVSVVDGKPGVASLFQPYPVIRVRLSADVYA